MAKLICPECGQQVKCCHWSDEEFHENDSIICIAVRGKHFSNRQHLEQWLIVRFEEKFTVVDAYVEKES